MKKSKKILNKRKLVLDKFRIAKISNYKIVQDVKKDEEEDPSVGGQSLK